MKIVLTFLQRRGEVSLEATEVSRSRATDGVVLLKSVRGRSAVVPLVGTFGWTNAVKGLSALLLRQAALQETPDSEVAAIEGEAGSFAASLDYAIAKRPNWIADMFGVSGSGELVIRRLVEISNHNRKRPGPVRIWVRPRSDLRVYVTVNGELVQDSWKLYDLARAINGENGSRLDPCVNGAAPCSGAQANQGVSEGDAGQGDESVVTDRRMPFSIEWQDRLRAEFMIEAQRALRNTGAFSPEWLKRTLSDLGSNQLFKSIAGDVNQFLNSVPTPVSSSALCGVAHDEARMLNVLNDGPPIRVAIGTGGMSSLVLFVYLKRVKGINIEINYRFSSSQEVVRLMQAGDFARIADASLLAVGCAGVVNSLNLPYKPLMLLPAITHRLMSLSADDHESLAQGEYLFLTDTVSSASFYFERMVQRGRLKPEGVVTKHLELHEITPYLKDSESAARCVAWWPYYYFCEEFTDARISETFDLQPEFDLAFFTVHESLIADELRARYLELAMRDAWLRLKRSPALLRQVIDSLLTDDAYMELFYRFNGLFNLADEIDFAGVRQEA